MFNNLSIQKHNCTEEPYCTMDNGSKYSISGQPWLTVYMEKQGLKWENLETERVTEYFKFGDSEPVCAKLKVRLPLTLYDETGEASKFLVPVHIISIYYVRTHNQLMLMLIAQYSRLLFHLSQMQ